MIRACPLAENRLRHPSTRFAFLNYFGQFRRTDAPLLRALLGLRSCLSRVPLAAGYLGQAAAVRQCGKISRLCRPSHRRPGGSTWGERTSSQRLGNERGTGPTSVRPVRRQRSRHLMRNILVSFAQFERPLVTQRMKACMARARKQGKNTKLPAETQRRVRGGRSLVESGRMSVRKVAMLRVGKNTIAHVSRRGE